MGKKIEISIQKLLEVIPTLVITREDFKYIFNNESVKEQFKRLYTMHTNGQYDVSVLEAFLIDNKDSLDIENLILTLAKNCKYQLEAFNSELKKVEEEKTTGIEEAKRKFVTIGEINKRIDMLKRTQKEVMKIAKGLDKILTFYYFDDEKKKYRVDVVDSREYIDGKHIGKSKNLRRFENIDKAFVNEDDENNMGIGYVLQVLNISDLKEVLPTKRFGIDVVNSICDNKLLKEKIKDKKQLEELKRNEPEEYKKLIEKMRFGDFSPYIKEALKEHIAYVDMDKLLLIAAYRYNYGLNNMKDENKTGGFEPIVKVILDNIEKKYTSITCDLEYDLQGVPVLEKITYSVSDLEKFSKQFVDDRYISDEKIKGYRSNIKSGESKLSELNPKYIDIIFSREELEEYANLSLENLEYVAEKLNWTEQQKIDRVIFSYEQNRISIEKIRELKENIDLTKGISNEVLNKYYQDSKEDNATEEVKERYKKYIELYKEILFRDEKQEEIEENYNKLMMFLLDNFKGGEYNTLIDEYYKQDLLTLEVLIEWNGEDIVTNLYNRKIINLQDLEELFKKGKLTFEYISDKYEKLIDDEELEYDDRLKILQTSYISEKKILDMYMKNLIFEDDLIELSKKGIIRETQVKKVINSRTKEDLEKNSSIKLLGLNQLRKRINIYSSDETNTEYKLKENKKNKLIIDPNERESLIGLLNGHIASTDLDEENPFYNYEFYVIPDESGGIGLNSVVIAERYYEDKIKEAKFALNNATYFFKYKDLMVLSNLKKNEMTKERKNIVFTANHTLATEERAGHWAASVIYSIAKTMLSSDLEEYSKENKRRIVLQKLSEVYSNDEIMEILEKASEIDSGEYVCEIREEVARNTKRYNKDDDKIDER